MKTQDLSQQDKETGNCPICGGETLPWLSVPGDWRRPDADRSYKILRCPSCEFGQIDPLPTPDTIAEAYDIDEYYTHGNEQKPSNSSLNHRLKQHLAWRFDRGVEPDDAWLDRLVAGGIERACDIGCGGGNLLLRLAARGVEAVGVDPDEKARAFATSKGATVVAGTAEDLPASLGGDFDAVFMSHVLEHTHDCISALRNISEILAPGGILSIEVPNNACRGLARAGASWFWLDAPRHLNFFSEPNLCRAVTTAGFEVEQVEFRGYSRQFEFGWEKAEEQISEFVNSRSLEPTRKKGSWHLLLATALAADPQKYDSIRVTCRKAPTPVTHHTESGDQEAPGQMITGGVQTGTPKGQRAPQALTY